MSVELSFVTGKGGVGKTRFSLALAKANPRFVLSETSDSLNFESQKIGFKAPAIHHFSRSDLAEEFLIHTIKLKTLAHWLGKSRMFQTLMQLAPNLHELLLLEKWMELAKKKPLIVDAPSTGNFLALFESIKTAKEIFDGGSLRDIADELDKVFSTPKSVTIYIVAIPEHSSLEEMKEIRQKVNEFYPNISCLSVINRKHEAAPEDLELTDSLEDLAYLRPKKEQERIKDHHFDFSFPEGATCL